jgi:zinc protease
MSVNRNPVMRLIVLLALIISSNSAWSVPALQTWKTGNGAAVLFVSAPDLPMVDVRVVFDAGSARDGSSPGLSRLTNALLTDGAGQWDADQIAQRMDSVGAKLGNGALKDMAWVSLRTLTDKPAYTQSVATLAEVLTNPTFPPDALERNRQMMLANLKQEEQSPGDVARKRFMHAVFGSHPYAIDSGGTKESLQAITRDDVVSQYRRYYVANNATIAIVGALNRKQAEELAERLTSGLPAGAAAPALPAVPELKQASNQHIPFPSSQSHILLGQPGMHRGDPDYFALYVGNHILGGGGLVSLLTEEVREKRGLSYSVYSYFSPMRADGPFILGAQTKNQQADQALDVMRKTLNAYIEQGPTDAELLAAKQNITGSFPLNIASNGKIVEYISMIGFYHLPLDYLDTLVGKVNAVTKEQIKDAFKRRVHPDRFVTVVVGDANKEKP